MIHKRWSAHKRLSLDDGQVGGDKSVWADPKQTFDVCVVVGREERHKMVTIMRSQLFALSHQNITAPSLSTPQSLPS